MAGRVTLITGCSTGIGKAIASRLAADPAKKYVVYATMRNLKKSEELQKEAGEHLDKTLFIRELDVLSTDSVKSAVRQVLDEQGRIDALVNNAGIAGFNGVEYMPYEEIQGILDTNFMGTVRMIKEVLPYMKEKRAGYVVNVSSLTGLLGYPFYEVYCASKFATEGLMDALASRMHEFNVRVCSVNPGPVTSNINDNLKQRGTLPDHQEFDDVTLRQLKLLGRYQKLHFDEGVAETAEDTAGFVQQVLETDDPPLRTITRPYCMKCMAYRYSDFGGTEWVTHKRRLVELPGVDIDELRRVGVD